MTNNVDDFADVDDYYEGYKIFALVRVLFMIYLAILFVYNLVILVLCVYNHMKNHIITEERMLEWK